jgi:hypothetical protein
MPGDQNPRQTVRGACTHVADPRGLAADARAPFGNGMTLVGGYRELPGGKWLVQVPATRYAAYHGDEWGEIVLSTREVLAFAEGIWAGRRINPVHRAGAEGGSALRDLEERRRDAS